MPSPLDALTALLSGPGRANEPTELTGLLHNRMRELQDNVAKQKALGAAAGFAYDQPTLLDQTNEELRSDSADPTAETLSQAPVDKLISLLGIKTQAGATVEAARQNKLGAFANAEAQRGFQGTQNEANRANARAIAETNVQGKSDLATQNAAAKQAAIDAKALPAQERLRTSLGNTQDLITRIQGNPSL